MGKLTVQLNVFTPLHWTPPDQTLCSRESWAAAGQEGVAVGDLVGGLLPDRHLPWGSRVLSADKSCQPRLAQPLCQLKQKEPDLCQSLPGAQPTARRKGARLRARGPEAAAGPGAC